MSQCNEAPNIYIVELDMAEAGKPVDWSRLPPANKPKGPRNGLPREPVRVALRRGKPAVLGRSGWKTIHTCNRVETDHGSSGTQTELSNATAPAVECFV